MTNKAYVAIQSVAGSAEPAMESLYDLFAGSSLDTTKWTAFSTGVGGSVSEGSGVLSVAVAAGIGQEGVYSNVAYDLTGSYAYVHCVSSTDSENFGLVLQVSQSQVETVDMLSILVSQGTLYNSWRLAGVDASPWSAPWDASTNGWLRIRESGGTTYWDGSADGVSWTNHASHANLFDVTALYPTLVTYNYTSVGAGVTEFADFNTTGSPPSYVYAPGSVTASAVVITSSGVFVGVWPTVTATFNYGDSNEDIRHALVAAVQAAAGDSTLDVEFVSG